jgi:hypothetical protein
MLQFDGDAVPRIKGQSEKLISLDGVDMFSQHPKPG